MSLRSQLELVFIRHIIEIHVLCIRSFMSIWCKCSGSFWSVCKGFLMFVLWTLSYFFNNFPVIIVGLRKNMNL